MIILPQTKQWPEGLRHRAPLGGHRPALPQDHYIASCCAMEGLHASNLSQPAYNDMEKIFQHTVDRGIKLIGLAPEAAHADYDGRRITSRLLVRAKASMASA